MGAPNFNFAPKFPLNGNFQPKFSIFEQNFSDKKKVFRQFFESPKLGRGQLSCPLPLLVNFSDYCFASACHGV